MAGRPLMLATLLGASIGVPYVVSQTSQSPSPQSQPGSVPATAPKPSWSSWSPFSFGSGSANSPLQPTYENLAPIQATRYHSIQEVLRFDVTKEWVYQNWARKSTGLGDPQLFGIRVALVTGTRMTDLAGSLTYQFDAQGQVQHISFRGRTADTTPLIQFLTSTYKFQRMEAPAGEQLYQVRSGKSVYSELRTRPESVLLETSPHGSFGVVLELGRPGSNRVLTPPTPRLEIPQVSTPAPPQPANAAAQSAGADGSNAPAEPALVGKIRPATQAEESHVLWRRWPN